jgi:P4 family phage/plasmid primase-like protien
MRYAADFPGIWSPETDEYMESIISSLLDSKGIVGYGSHNYVVNVLKKMRSKLTVRKWLEPSPKELLPFQNGVLEVKTGKLLPHSPGYRFTWSLPRVHNPLATNWSPIHRWMDEATGGNQQMQKILLCWLNALLKGRSDLQVFLHLTGPGGSGKGTFTRLCTALVGERNNYNSTLEDWNGNRFESANAYRKRLVTFPDEDKYSGGLGRFKQMTGGDLIRGEEKGKKAFQYIYDGMVLVVSNYPIFAGDTSSGLARRLLMVPFTHQVPKSQRRNLEQEFAPYLDALTNYVLALPDEEVTSTLLQLANESPQVTEQVWDYRMRTDSIAAWINECCIHDPDAMTPVGSDKDQAEALFGSYWQYCQRTGGKPKGSREFSPSLLDLCNHILHWTDVQKLCRNNGKFITGLRLRSDADANLPNPIDALSTTQVTGDCRHGDGLSDGLKLALDKERDGSDGSTQFPNYPDENPGIFTMVESAAPQNLERVSLPSLPSLSNPGLGFSPSPHPSVTESLPVTAIRAESSQQLILPTAPLAQSPSPEVGGLVEVWMCGEWVKAQLLSVPNDHPDPCQRTTGWKTRILATGLERYFWNANEFRQASGG